MRIRAGANAPVELILRPGKSSASFEFDDAAAAERPPGERAYSFEVEYRWGYAREAWYKGSADADELVLPFPGSTGEASFPFPRR